MPPFRQRVPRGPGAVEYVPDAGAVEARLAAVEARLAAVERQLRDLQTTLGATREDDGR